MAQDSRNPRPRLAGTNGFIRPLVRAAYIGATLVVAAVPAFAFENLTPAETDALNVRRLQSDMMVAALSCQMRDEYNVAVKRFQPELVRHGANLRGLFERTYGARGEKELNSFVTRLANESSVRRVAAGASYCGNAAAQFTRLDALPQTQLAQFSAGGVFVAAVPAVAPKPPVREAGLPR